MNEEIHKLNEKRRKHVESCKENHDYSYQVISNLYSEKSHFIYEILQNAEDVEATRIIFDLKENFLKITHNGNLFKSVNVDAITAVGYSPKLNELNKIGKFGIGFKSVFGFTVSPEIHSGNYHFKITKFIVPEEIDPIDCGDDTIIIIPFNHSKLKPDEAYKIIKEKLEDLKTESILFLRNIQNIQWESNESKGYYLKADINICRNIKWICVDSQKDDGHEYLVFDKDIQIEDKTLKIEVAYYVDLKENNQKFIAHLHNTKLSVYFPTKEKIELNFLLQAPYKTTPNRETIDFKDAQNEIITKEISELVVMSLSKLKKLGFINIAFIDKVLPIDAKSHTLYATIRRRVIKYFNEEALLPTYEKGGYTKASQALLARGKILADFLKNNDIKLLFEKETWLSTEITEGKTPALRNYLMKQLNVKEIQFEDFVKAINEKFIANKSDEWMIAFYTILLEQKSIYEILQSKPIIRLTDDRHVCPYGNDGKPNAYLPNSTILNFNINQLNVVKNIFIRDSNSREFLRKLGLKDIDRIEIIKKHILPKYQSDKPSVKTEEYFKDLEIIFDIYRNSFSRRDEFIDIFKEIKIIKIQSVRQPEYRKPYEAYMPFSELKLWFNGNSRACFLDDETYKKFNNNIDFFIKIGIREEIKMEGIEQYYKDKEEFSDGKKYYVRGKDGFNPDFNIDGLNFAIDNINFERSLLIWEIILEKSNKLYGKIEQSSRKDFLKISESNENASIAFKLLVQSNQNWLYDRNARILRKPISEIGFDDLHEKYFEEYTKENPKNYDLGKVLGFRNVLRANEIKDIENKIRREKNIDCKILTGKDLEDFSRWIKEKEEKEKIIEQKKWKPEVSPNEIKSFLIEENFELSKSESPDLSGQRLKKSYQHRITDDDNTNSFREQNKKNETLTPRDKKEIGKWGEEFVKKSLEACRKDNTKIIPQNENGRQGEGYDFVITRGDKEIEYIEVKSKTTESPEFIDITKTQWEWATKLYEKGEGDKYFIYVVSNAGLHNAKIRPLKNPIKLWKQGKLKAHPVRIEL